MKRKVDWYIIVPCLIIGLAEIIALILIINK